MEPLITAESPSIIRSALAATAAVTPTANTTDNIVEQHGPLHNNSIYICLPIFCAVVASLYISVWVWSCHRSWHREHREAKKRLDHWRNHMLLTRVSTRLSKHLHEIKWPSQHALPKWRKERPDSTYGVRRDTYMKEDGKADYSLYGGDTISVELPSSSTFNHIPFSPLRHHKSLNAKTHRSPKSSHRRAWRSHDLRNFNPVTFRIPTEHSWIASSTSSISVAGTACSGTTTIFERAGSDTNSIQYPNEKV
ncbi:hypothetical protein K450DRAFT_271222 [Umbelopsis ramanniana AG]|uniref:Uncharacterized protein n=1 Tax=Umbelopsis ramanniana AG TaxID=1314678 RepID=A0AAD5EAG1_UMBRA|nr:uncharacterized protein K450DRAFT_271222 [Umbelopsis ramanniana AG]KAI8580378.1 hypothetical protein K450DRAFT_271222 [Umbelopsis ramanniana AG]